MQKTKLLVLDSSTPRFVAGVFVGGKIYSGTLESRPHSQRALPLVNSLLAWAKTSLEEMDAFAFGGGPGLFSGLRLSCALAQAFGYAHNKPVIVIPTLLALAKQCPAPPNSTPTIAATLPAHREGVFFAAYKICSGQVREVCAPQMLGHNEPLPVHVDFARYGGAPHPQVETMGKRAAAAGIEAETLYEIACALLAAGEGCDAKNAAPLYIREKIAQTTAERAAQK